MALMRKHKMYHLPPPNQLFSTDRLLLYKQNFAQYLVLLVPEKVSISH